MIAADRAEQQRIVAVVFEHPPSFRHPSA
jgi:hypothetical protein